MGTVKLGGSVPPNWNGFVCTLDSVPLGALGLAFALRILAGIQLHRQSSSALALGLVLVIYAHHQYYRLQGGHTWICVDLLTITGLL